MVSCGRRSLLKAMLVAGTATFAFSAHAEEYPVKPIKIIVPYPAGGTTDVLARLFADKLRAKFGQAVIVENRGGAAGNIGAEFVYKSPGDGYTLLFAAPAPFAINKSLYKKLGYEPDGFIPVSLTAQTPNVLVTSPKSGLESLPQLMSAAKSRPDQLNYASQGNGSTSHLTAELFKAMGNVKIVHIPYKGSSPALTDLIGGQVDMMFVEISSVMSYIKAGTLRAIAVASEQRSPLLPNVPAVSEVLPGFSSATWFALAAPPKTPSDVVNKLSSAIDEAIKQPDTAKRLTEMNLEPVGGPPAALSQFIKLETERWSKVIRVSGAAAD